jgi:hypothetical protein
MDDDDDLYGDLGLTVESLRTPASPPEQDDVPELAGGNNLGGNNNGLAANLIPGLAGNNSGGSAAGNVNESGGANINNFGAEGGNDNVAEANIDSPLSPDEQDGDSPQHGLDEALAADVRSALIGGGLLESFDFEGDDMNQPGEGINPSAGDQSNKRSSSSKRNSNSSNSKTGNNQQQQLPSSSSSHAPVDPRDPRARASSSSSSHKKRSASSADLPPADANRNDIKRTRTASASAGRGSPGRHSQSQGGGVNFDFDGEGEEGNDNANDINANDNDANSVAVEPSADAVNAVAVEPPEEDALPDAEGSEFDRLREFEAKYSENGGNEGEIPLEIFEGGDGEGFESYVDFAAEGIKEEELARVKPGYRSDKFVLGEMVRKILLLVYYIILFLCYI